MFKRLGFFSFIFILSSTAWAAEAPLDTTRLSLKDALTMAQERNAQVIMADERVQQALSRLGEAKAGLLPQFKGVVSGARQSIDLRGMGFAPATGDPHVGPFNVFDARMRLTQAIFDPAAMNRLNAASEGKQLSMAERRKIDEDMLALVATLYVNAHRANERLMVSRAFLKRDLKQLQNNGVQYKQGTASTLDVERARSQYAQSLFQWRRAHTEETQARLDLCAALGLSLDERLEYSYDDGIAENYGLADVNMNDTLKKHPDLNLAQEKLDVSKAERGVEKSQWLPQVSGLADYGSSGESPDASSNTYSVGVQATIPIWEGGNREHKITEASSRVRENETNVDDVKRQTQARALTAIDIIKQAKAAIGQAQAQMTVAETESKLALKKLNMGNASQQDVLDARANLAFAVDQEAEALATYRLAQVNLAHALGRMQDLLQIQ